MSNSRKHSLEFEINRYLDGDISDEEFERFLSDYPEGIDFERLRVLKSRVERIEELYRQIEEPTVPNGYWDSFADRVSQRLPGTRSIRPIERVLSFVLPWRWPVAAYGYAGAVASVLLIFFIGKAVQEGGQDAYTPLRIESVSKISPVAKQAERADMKPSIAEDFAAESVEAEEYQPEVVSKMEEAAQGSETASKDLPALPETYIEKPAREEKAPSAHEEGRAAPDVEQVVDKTELREVLPPSVDYDAAEVEVGIIEPVTDLKSAKSTAKGDLLPETVIDPLQAVTRPEDEAVVIDMDKGRRGKGDRLPQVSMAAGNIASDSGREDTIWAADDLNVAALVKEYEFRELSLDASSYSGDSFLRHVKMLAVVARTGRDPAQINDAIAAIDTLIKYNTSIDKELWLARRSSLESMITSPAEP